MSPEDPTRERIESILSSHPVTLFMKGDRELPQCGFSATVVRILDTLIPDYHTVDVLADPEIREGIKRFSSWPTIPQLYVKGDFLGGCDIVQELFATRELHATLGVACDASAEPAIELSEEAAAALRHALREAEGQGELHLAIDARFQSSFYLAPGSEGEIAVSSQGLELRMDPMSAARADGLKVDVIETPQGRSFGFVNPNAPQ